MKKSVKLLRALICLFVCASIFVTVAPMNTLAAGMMRIIIDDTVYDKVRTDMGVLDVTHWHYDSSEDKLTLKNFGSKEKPQTKIFLYPYSGNMTVELQGDNYITVSGSTAFIAVGNITFVGDGTLTVVANDSACIYSEYGVSITQGVNLNLTGVTGITSIRDTYINTTGTINITTMEKAINAAGNVDIYGGDLNFECYDGIYSSAGNIYICGGTTDVEITSRRYALWVIGAENYFEYSPNGTLVLGDNKAQAKAATQYNKEKYMRLKFTGLPQLGVPRRLYWDDTQIAEGIYNPVGRWSPVKNASAYKVTLYMYNSGVYYPKMTATTEGLSFNFGLYITNSMRYYFTVQALGDGVEYVDGLESERTSQAYYPNGDLSSRYYITLPESNYYTITPESGKAFVEHGDDYVFTLDVDPAYSQSEVLVWALSKTVDENGKEQDVKTRVFLQHGKYTIRNVTTNVTVIVGDMSLNTYTVTLPESDAFTIYPLPDYSTTVNDGDDFAFSIELAEIYQGSNIKVYVDGELLTPKFGIIYTISNIKSNKIVAVTGLIRDEYDVSFKMVDGTVISSQIFAHGSFVAEPEPPAPAEGLTFVGWTYANGDPYNFKQPVSGVTDIYARYEPEKQDDVYLISNLETLKWFRDEVNFGNCAINARLTADIDLNSGKYTVTDGAAVFDDGVENWLPIGGYDYTNQEDYVRFYTGKFDGNNHTISGVYISCDAMASDASYLGVFGILGNNSSVTNLNVKNSYLSGYSCIGGIAGKSYGVISGCTSDATLKGYESVGGIVGETSDDVEKCTNNGSVTVNIYDNSLAGDNAGGIVGRALLVISVTDCENNGSIYSYNRAGGIVGGGKKISIVNCNNNAPVDAVAFAAGIIAYGESCEISNSFNIAPVSGNYASGIISDTPKLVAAYTYNTGDVTANKIGGGFTSFLEEDTTATLKQCYNFGKITAEQIYPITASASVTAEDVYYCQNYYTSTIGTAIPYSWFRSGYLAVTMNKANGASVWSQGEKWPEFAAEGEAEYSIGFSGNGTQASPYIIADETDLYSLSNLVNNVNGYGNKVYSLTADIKISVPSLKNNIEPIGTKSSKFSGKIIGNGHYIDGLNIDTVDEGVGLIGFGYGCIVSDLTVQNSVFKGDEDIGAFVGNLNSGDIFDCSSLNNTVGGNSYVGGIVGAQFGSLSNVKSSSTVSGTKYAGGISGSLLGGTVTLAENRGSVSGDTYVAGICGDNYGDLLNVVNLGSIKAKNIAAGITGENGGTILFSFAYGSVTADTNAAPAIYEDLSETELDTVYYLSGIAPSNGIGVEHNADMFKYGGIAYYMNECGTKTAWAQGENYPVLAESEADAIIYGVSFKCFDELYYFVGTTKGGAAHAPADPVYSGYTFLRWDLFFNQVYSNLTVNAVFEQSGAISFTATSGLGIKNNNGYNIIVGIDPMNKVTVKDFKRYVANTRYDITYEDYETLDENELVFSGMTVSSYNSYGNRTQMAHLVIYGDLSGDGKIGGTDLFILNMIINGLIGKDDISLACYYAGDVNRDGVIDEADYKKLSSYTFGETFIDNTFKK